MQVGSDTLAALANHWLARFEHALGSGDAAALAALFRSDGHWRDVLAFSWRIRTVSGAQAIAAQLELEAPLARASGFRTDPERTAPRHATRAGAKCVEAIFRFETAAGRGSGVLRFLADADASDPPRAWTLLTTLEELRGHEERIGPRRPTGQSYSRDFSGPNWLDKRRAASAYTDRDPQVLVVGGGQAGLSIAARLKALGVDALVVDRWPRIGDNWRRRYHALTLHNQVHVNHLPYLAFPPTWPVYIPKDMLASWFEAYV
ncbi:MAG TPA: NAD(P)-binding protein, partial [Burkholderiales bacterium]|nr:NAD(P)-binding protein [Burkholderiales bacterium]